MAKCATCSIAMRGPSSTTSTLLSKNQWRVGAKGMAGGAEGAEALSGLARGFFYAGARALLVSHWAVDSDATVKLINRSGG